MLRPGLRFAHRLALALGRADVRGMLRELTSEQFARWEAYFLLEPFGPPGDDVRAARVCASVANFSAKYRKADWAQADFMPAPPERPEPKIEGLGGKLIAALKAMGARVSHRG